MRGRPFKAGCSGNPGGRPRVVREVREIARQCAPDAIKELARLALRQGVKRLVSRQSENYLIAAIASPLNLSAALLRAHYPED